MVLDHIPHNDFHLVIDAEIQEKTLVNHHKVSFDTFTEVGIEQIITSVFKLERTIQKINRSQDKDKDIDYVFLEIIFTKVYISSPTTINPGTNVEEPLLPLMAIRRELTYEGAVHVDATIRATAFKKNGTTVVREEYIKNQFLLKMPIMVKSRMCHLRNFSKAKLLEIGEDPDDLGGYFIINGLEKVIECIENTAYNQPRIFVSNYEKEVIRCEMISQPGDYFLNSDQFILRWNKDKSLTIEIHRDALAKIQIPFFMLFRLMDWHSDKMIVDAVLNGDYDSPLSIEMFNFMRDAFEANYENFKVFEIHDRSELIKIYSDHAYKLYKDKFKYLNIETIPENWSKVYHYVQQRILENFLPHLGKEEKHNSLKLKFIAQCIRYIFLTHKGHMAPTDRDSYDTKRVAAAGDTFAKAFKNSFNSSVIRVIRTKISHEFESTPFDNINFQQLLKSVLFNTDFSKRMRQAFNAKDKSKMKTDKKKGSQMSPQNMARKNELANMSILRSVTANDSAAATAPNSERAIDMRNQHPTHIGYMCLGQTPLNGAKVGLTKNCAISTTITKAYSSEQMKTILLQDTESLIPYSDVYPRMVYEESLVLVNVNGYPVGYCRDAFEFCSKYRKLRRRGHFTREISVVRSHQFGSVMFYADAGRPIRPLIVVYNTERDPEMFTSKELRGGFRQKILITPEVIAKLKSNEITMKDMCDNGMVEYIDVSEQADTLICPDYSRLIEDAENEEYEYTHLEIPIAIYGIVALSSPFANHNEPVRLMYQCSQAAQTMGKTAYNWALRTNDKDTSIQYNLENPIVKTFQNNYVNSNGVNVVIAVMSYSGYNVEDSIIFNKGAIDRGLFHSFKLAGYKTEFESKEYFDIPDPMNTLNPKNENYEKLRVGEIHGMPRRGSLIQKDDPLIGKIYKFPKTVEDRKDIDYLDKSIIYKDEEPAVVHEVLLYKQDGDKLNAKVVLRKPRSVELGDKFSARSGQKGVVSAILRESDMPFTEHGIVPDIIINPHSFPTRMTMGQYYEMLFGKLGALEGTQIDGTIFSEICGSAFDNSPGSVGQLLELHGYRKDGYEKMYSGITGQYIDALIYTGVNTLQRLQKSAVDQENTVGKCPTDALSYQPLDGKQQNGGIRYGEMERDVFNGLGLSMALYEKMFAHSDGYTRYVCKCGRTPVVNIKANLIKCYHCKDGAEIRSLSNTYSAKLVDQEMNAINVDTKLYTDPFAYETYRPDLEAKLL